MKHFTLQIAAALSTTVMLAQPQIENGTNLPEVGTEYTFSVALTSNPGPSGANQVWDFSQLPSAYVADAEIIDPMSSPLFNEFSTADYAFSFTVDGATAYSFFNVTSDKMEVLAYVVAAPGGENDYSPNPRTMLKFPFDFQEQEVDTWEEAGNSENTVTLTYDGYGTLMTPGGTFQNVVRIRENYAPGEDDYQWYTLDPLMQVAVYDHNDEILFFAGGLATSVDDAIDSQEVSIYPNPAKDHIMIEIPESIWLGDVEYSIHDITGKTVQRGITIHPVSRVELVNSKQGAYFIQLSHSGKPITTQRFIIE